MAVFTEKKEIILTPDTVLPKDIKKLNASKVIYCLVNRVIVWYSLQRQIILKDQKVKEFVVLL